MRGPFRLFGLQIPWACDRPLLCHYEQHTSSAQQFADAHVYLFDRRWDAPCPKYRLHRCRAQCATKMEDGCMCAASWHKMAKSATLAGFARGAIVHLQSLMIVKLCLVVCGFAPRVLRAERGRDSGWMVSRSCVTMSAALRHAFVWSQTHQGSRIHTESLLHDTVLTCPHQRLGTPP